MPEGVAWVAVVELVRIGAQCAVHAVAETAGIAERMGWMSTTAFHQLCFCPTLGCRRNSKVCSAMPMAVPYFIFQWCIVA